MPNIKNELLTQAELKLMNLLWELGETTVRGVKNHMSDGESIPYTTIAAVIRLLAKKGYLHQRLQGKTLYYSPAVEKQDYESRTISHIVDSLFSGATLALATRLIDDKDLSLEELRKIRDELDKKLSTQ